MADDVETMLAGLEQRLRALQTDLAEPEGTVTTGTVPEGTVTTGRREPEGTVPSHLESTVPTRPPAPADPLDAFGEDLRRLVTSFDRIVSDLRGPPTAAGYVFTGDVAVDARVDFRTLCQLGQALTEIPGVGSVQLRAFAGQSAALDVALTRPVALVEELRRTLRASIALIEAREGRLSIEVDSLDRNAPGTGA